MDHDEGATQQGVPADEQQVNNKPAEDKKPPEPTERELAIERIANARVEKFEEETGQKITDPDANQDDKAAEEERKKLEEAATKDADTAKKDEVTDTAKQLEAHAAGDELILDAATLAKAKVRIKVDGQEELVPADKVLSQYQKGAAADVRLAEATRLQREAQQAYEAALAKASTATGRDEKREAQKAADDAKSNVDIFKKAADALFEGDAERASRLMAEAVAVAAPKADEGRSNATQVDPLQVADIVMQRMAQERALNALFTDYPEIKADPDLQQIADKYVNVFVAQGKSLAEAIAEAGEVVGEKFKIGKHGQSGRPQQSNATTREQRLANKANLDEVQASSARASTTAPSEPTASDIIAEIRKQRGYA